MVTSTVVFVLVEFGQRRVALSSRRVFTKRRRRSARSFVRRQQFSRADDAKTLRRVGDRLPAERSRKGCCRAIASSSGAAVDEGLNRRGQQIFVRGERSMPFDGEVSLGQRLASPQLSHQVGLQASSGEQRRLNSECVEPVSSVACGIDKYSSAVGPCGLSRLDRRHLESAAGQRGRK